MFCSNCGKEVQDGQSFCPNCGAATAGTQKAGTVPVGNISADVNIKRLKRCPGCGQVYERKRKWLPIILIASGLVISFFALIIVGVPLVIIGIAISRKEACPHCGHNANQISAKKREEQSFGKLNTSHNTAFYQQLHDLNSKYKLRFLCGILCVAAAALPILSYVKEVNIAYYIDDVVEVEESAKYIDILYNADNTIGIVCLMCWIIGLVFAVGNLRYSESIKPLNRYCFFLISGISVVLNLIMTEKRVLDELLYAICRSSWVREMVDGGEATIGGVRFGVIAWNLLAMVLAFLVYQFSKAEWLHKKAAAGEAA